MKKFLRTLRNRWRNAMPKFFSRVCWTASLVSGSALTAHEAMKVADIQPHDWWLDIAPYLIGFSAGIAFAAKFTQKYSGKPINKADSGSPATDDTPVEIPLPSSGGTPDNPDPLDIEPLDMNDM